MPNTTNDWMTKHHSGMTNYDSITQWPTVTHVTVSRLKTIKQQCTTASTANQIISNPCVKNTQE